MVRHGRAGQRQYGVDIVGRNGAVYPIGLQCKRKTRWPVSRLTKKEVDEEVMQAEKFRPKLKAFYLLTTAPDDIALQAHVRAINEEQKKNKSFEVILLGWNEILRRATKDIQIATKHFGPNGGSPLSPLLGTWYTEGGRLEKPDAVISLDFRELWQDFQDWPNGHIIIRQRETDILVQKIAALEESPKSKTSRERRFELREQLSRLRRREEATQDGVKRMCTMPELRFYLYMIKQPAIAAKCTIGFIHEQMLVPDTKYHVNQVFLRMYPPNNLRKIHLSTVLDETACKSIKNIMGSRTKHYGKPLTTTVDELPDDVFARIGIPRIMRGIVQALSDEERVPISTLIAEEWFKLGQWSLDYT
jgi:hypothetical protein